MRAVLVGEHFEHARHGDCGPARSMLLIRPFAIALDTTKP